MHQYIIDQQWEHFSAQEHAVWQTLFTRQMQLLPGVACDALVQGLGQLPLQPDQIPHFGRLTDALQRICGWSVVAVEGLVPDDVFFEMLAQRIFPAGNFIRRADQLDYLEEPDVFHDVFGHIAMLTHPVMADFMQLYGRAGAKAIARGRLQNLARVYWYTVEFGLVLERGEPRIYGAGISSSYGESQFAVLSQSPNRLRFDLERVMRTDYHIDDYQPGYFVLDKLDDLLELERIEFDPLYARLASGPSYAPGEVLSTDRVLHLGDGSYHRNKYAVAAAC